MKTGKKIVVVGAVGVIGYLAYLYFKKKQTTSETGTNNEQQSSSGGGFLGSLPPFIQSILPNGAEGNSNTTPQSGTGTSAITPDPLSTSQIQIKEAVIAEIKKEESVDMVAQAKEASDYLAKRALVEKLDVLKRYQKLKLMGVHNISIEMTNELKRVGYDSKVNLITQIATIESTLKNQYGLYPDASGVYKV
jgi:hypothetical protein